MLASFRPINGMKGISRRGWSAAGLRFGAFRAIVPAAPLRRASFRSACSPMIEESAQQASDRLLLAGVARGEQAAFAELYDRLSGPLFSLCLRMTGEAQEAEDILQEACMVIWRRADSYDAERSSVFSWAVHLTRCKAIDHLRARGRRLRVLLPPDANGGITQDESGGMYRTLEAAQTGASTAADALDQSEQAARVRRVLSALPAEQSQAIEMAFFGDLSHYEISSRLAEPLGTIKARIRRGLLKLRDDLKGGMP